MSGIEISPEVLQANKDIGAMFCEELKRHQFKKSSENNNEAASLLQVFD